MKLHAEAPSPRAFLKELFGEAVAAVQPRNLVAPFLPPQPKGRVFVVGAGKASAAMAAAVETAWPDADLSGLVVTRYGHAAPCERIRIVEAGHPVPDAAGMAAAREMLEIARRAGADDLLLCLMSGGGSALIALPAEGVTLADKQELSRCLLASGAPIGDINRVRIALSAIKGGRLALAAEPARVVTLVISDVPGNDPALVASGPSIPSTVSAALVRSILDRWNIAETDAVRHCIAALPQVDVPHELPTDTHVIATSATMLAAAAQRAQEQGVEVIVLGDSIEGEARDVASDMAKRIGQIRADTLGRHPLLLLSGGETSVTKVGTGRGGRNSEFLLALALAFEGAGSFTAIACDSDGIDGSEDNAGAIADEHTLGRARALGLDPRDHLMRNDSYTFFAALNDLVVTGPTRTNVNDFRAILLGGASSS